MDIRDITKEQLETLVMIRLLEEFITDEHENLSSLSETIWTLEESLSDKEHKQLVKDICKLTETGYLLSDGTREHVEMDEIPEVEGITPKGKSALNEWEQEMKKGTDNRDDTIINSYSLFGGITINNSLVGGITNNNSLLSNTVGSNSLFRILANKIKESMHL